MSASWPPRHLRALAEALPWDYRRRGLAWEVTHARWQAEAAVAASAGLPVTALLLQAGGDCEDWLRTLVCWSAQTAPHAGWWVVGQTDEPWCGRREAAGLPPPRGCVREVDAEQLGCDFALAAHGGDLLHPSLAWVVALAARDGANAVYWDWLEYSESVRGISLQARVRAPWRDLLRELQHDVRGRAFALPAAAWEGFGSLDGWDVRMHARVDDASASAHLHTEPLTMHRTTAAMRSTLSIQRTLPVAQAHWGVAFEQRRDGLLQPAEAARSVSVVLMYRDRPELTRQAIDSLIVQQTQTEIELVLVDNDSCAATREAVDAMLRTLPERVRTIRLHAPGAFNHSGQVQQAVAAASGEVLLLLNNDARFLHADALDQMARWARLPGIASVGVAVVDAAGEVVGGGMRARRMPGAEFNSPVEEVRGLEGSYPRQCIGNSFACAAMSAAAWRTLGGTDTARFPAGYNDVDYGLRASAAGWTHLNLGHVQVAHQVGSSRGRQDEVAQKTWLRMRHPWVATHALQESAREPLEALYPALPRIGSAASGARADSLAECAR
jgi:GT2 family glycosyltransferase